MANHEEQQDRQKVQLSFKLRTSSPHALSIRDASPSEPFKIIATVKQIASPFPDRAVTILTKYSYLPLQPGGRITFTRISGDPDLLQRGEEAGFTFVAMGQGYAEIVWELSPARLMQRLGDKDETVEDKLLRLFRPGDAYKVEPSDLGIRWWAFGSLEEEEGIKKKVARWSLPNDLSFDRIVGEDATEPVTQRLKDFVDLHDVNHLSSRSAIEGEQRPVIKKLRSEGWIFGEPKSGLAIVNESQDEGAVFTITE